MRISEGPYTKHPSFFPYLEFVLSSGPDEPVSYCRVFSQLTGLLVYRGVSPVPHDKPEALGGGAGQEREFKWTPHQRNCRNQCLGSAAVLPKSLSGAV